MHTTEKEEEEEEEVIYWNTKETIIIMGIFSDLLKPNLIKYTLYFNG